MFYKLLIFLQNSVTNTNHAIRILTPNFKRYPTNPIRCEHVLLLLSFGEIKVDILQIVA